MQYELILTGRFKKSLKLDRKRGLDISLLVSKKRKNDGKNNGRIRKKRV